MDSTWQKWVIKVCVVMVTVSLCFCELFVEKGLGWMAKLSLEELTNKASHVVTGKIISMKSSWNPENTKIYTDVTISVQEVIKGFLSTREITLRQLGGEIPEEDMGMKVSDTAEFSINEDVLIFMRPHETGFTYKVVGGSQGKYTLKNGIVVEKRLLLKNLRTQIKDIMRNLQEGN